MNIKVKLGKVFRKIRKTKGLSQEEFAHRVGTHRTYIGMIERAEKNSVQSQYKSGDFRIPRSVVR